MDNESRDFSSKHVQRATDLTYRQINDWDERGAIPHSRKTDKGWRRYSARDVFALMVASELHKRFGIPVHKLRYVLAFMTQDGAHHLNAAQRLMAQFGIGVWLLTDFESAFIVDSELEYDDLMQYGMMGGVAGEGFVMLKVNPIVNRLLESLDLEPWEDHGAGYELLKQIRGHASAASESERWVLQAIRSRAFKKIEIAMRDGSIETISTSEDRDTASEVADLLREHPYQTVTVHMSDGGIVSVVQQATSKPKEDAHP
jgi:hypothetical protein